MLKNYFTTASRYLLKSKTFSLLNILGLAFGLCCALLIALWVHDEYSVDQFHSKKDRIYWVLSELKMTNGSQLWTSSPGPLAEILENDIPGIDKAVRFTNNRDQLFKNDSLKFEESGIAADPAFLTLFDFPLLQGDHQSALEEPNSVVISSKLANKLFPNQEALNQSVTIDDWGTASTFKITGILDKIPDQSTFQFDFIIPYKTYLKPRPWNMEWGNFNDKTVVLLDDGIRKKSVDKQITNIVKEHAEGSTAALHLYPFKDIYLKSHFSQGLDAEGRIVYVRIFTLIAVVILLIACINFMNLSTARASKRAKEVGVRKATGASKNSLITQFLCESVLIALLSGILAITVADLLLTPFNHLTDKSIHMPYGNFGFLLIFAGVCLLTGLLAGIYPAIYLSSYNPATVLKGTASSGKSLLGFRRVLVVFQFSLSITFVITTIIVFNQLQYIIHKDVGLNKTNILHHDLNGLMSKREAFRNELMQLPGVKEVTSANFSPLQINNTTYSVSWQGKPEDANIPFHVIQTDPYFLHTFGLQLLEGRNFSNQYDTAALEVLVNEEAARTMGLSTTTTGSKISVWDNEVEVVGIVKDFNHQSLDKKIEPVVIFHNPVSAWQNFVAIDGDVTQTREAIEKTYLKYENRYPFSYGFVDQDFESTYSYITIMGRLSNIFALVAIFVSCLGLFGLSSYMTEQRKKETGIRKALGATSFGLVKLLSKNFLLLVVIAFFISAPIAWYISSQWLTDFAYRIDLNVWPFLTGGLLATIIAIGTVSFHTIQAARSNPVDALKYD